MHVHMYVHVGKRTHTCKCNEQVQGQDVVVAEEILNMEDWLTALPSHIWF